MLLDKVKQKFKIMKLFLSGDVSKGYADWIILTEKKQAVLKNFQLNDTHEGHCKLYSVIKEYFNYVS